MSPAEWLNDLSRHLIRRRSRWIANLPEHFGTFLGHPVRLEFDAIPSGPRGSAIPPPDQAELGLIRAVVLNLKATLADAEARFVAEYSKLDVDLRAHVRDPHIWIQREERAGKRPEQWTLVVGTTQNEDYGVHIEFSGTTLSGMWGGD